MTHYRVQERGMIKPEEIAIGRGTGRYTPEFIPRTKVEVILMDDQVEVLINRLIDKLGDALGGKIIILNVPTIVDLSTRRRGEDAMCRLKILTCLPDLYPIIIYSCRLFGMAGMTN
jgi:nitrogen regulatory protein P-II 1